MKDFSLHLFDILENSVRVGASRITVELSYRGSWLEFCLHDNGPGFPPSILENPADPFRTTRTERPVGLGLSLLKQTVMATGGRLATRNRQDGGAEVSGRICMSHIDACPLGDLPQTLLSAVVGWPALDMVVRVGPAGKLATILDTEVIKQEIGTADLSHPSIMKFMREAVNEGLREVAAWLACLQEEAWLGRL